MAEDYIPYSGPIITQTEARKMGLRRYFTGKPCRKAAHFSQRYACSGDCIQCARDKATTRTDDERSVRATKERLRREDGRVDPAKCRRWGAVTYARHRLAILHKQQTRLRTPEGRKKRRLYMRQYRASTPGYVARERVYNRKYRQLHPEMVRSSGHAAYVRRRGTITEGLVLDSDILDILRLQRHRCANSKCRVSLKNTGYHLDHITPLALGGSHLRTNLQALCPACNRRKWAKDPLDWARENGLLL